MIIDALVTVLASLMGAIGSMFGVLTMPGWWSSVDDGLLSLAGYASGFGAWFPIGSAISALTFVVAVVAIALTIKLIRIVASFFTAGGGSAA